MQIVQMEQDVLFLENEIQQILWQMFAGVYLAVALMLVSYIAGVITRKVELFKLVLALAVSAAGIVALCHYKIDSNASYIRQADEILSWSPESLVEQREINLPPYEKWKVQLQLRPPVIFVADLLSAAVGFYVLWKSGKRLRRKHGRFVQVTGALTLLALILAAASSLLAGR